MSQPQYDFSVGAEIELVLDTQEDHTTALAGHIDWKDPMGNTGVWVGTVDTQYIRYQLLPGDITVSGTWEFQSFIRRADNSEVHGKYPVKACVGPAIAGDGHVHP